MMPFFIGSRALDGRAVWLAEKDLLLHQAIFGGTRKGKSKLAEAEIRYHIRRGDSVWVFDPHGFLVQDLVPYVAAGRYEKRVIVVDPNDAAYAIGLNFLAPNGQEPATQAAGVMNAVFKVFGEDQSAETKPRLERRFRGLLIALIEAGLTLSDALDFLAVSNTMVRRAVVDRIANPYIQSEWLEFDAIAKRSDKETLIESVLNRVAKLILTEQIRRIVGQLESTIKIDEIVETGKTVLVNLQPLRASREAMQVLGILLIDQLVAYALTRTRKQAARRPFFVFVDEASELVSNDLPYGLHALSKYGAFFRLFFQNLEMIRKPGVPGYFDNVMSNCHCKVAFQTSYADAEDLVGEFFSGQITGEEVKLDIERYDILPRESERESTTETESEAVTESEAESDGTMQSEGTTDVRSSGSGTTSGFGAGRSEVFVPGDWGFDTQINYSRSSSESSGRSDSWSESDGYSSMSGTTHSVTRGKASTKGRSVGRTRAPFIEHHIEKNLGSRQYFSIQEIKEKFIAALVCQPQRHAYLKLPDRPAAPVITAYVKEAKARPKDIAGVIQYSNEHYAVPIPIVDKMIAERRKLLLADTQEEPDDEEHWQSA